MVKMIVTVLIKNVKSDSQLRETVVKYQVCFKKTLDLIHVYLFTLKEVTESNKYI